MFFYDLHIIKKIEVIIYESTSLHNVPLMVVSMKMVSRIPYRTLMDYSLENTVVECRTVNKEASLAFLAIKLI